MLYINKDEEYQEINFEEINSIEEIIRDMKNNPLTSITINEHTIYGTSDDLERDLLNAIDSINELGASPRILKIKKGIEERILRNLAKIDENDIIFKYCLGLAKRRFLDKKVIDEFERLQVFRYTEDDNSLRLMVSLLQGMTYTLQYDKDNSFLNLFNSINSEKERNDLNLAMSLIKTYTKEGFIINHFLELYTLNEIKAKQKRKLEVIDGLQTFHPNK